MKLILKPQVIRANFCHNGPYAIAENFRSNKVIYTLPLMSTSKVIVNARKTILHVHIHLKKIPFNIFVPKSNCCKILLLIILLKYVKFYILSWTKFFVYKLVRTSEKTRLVLINIWDLTFVAFIYMLSFLIRDLH